MQEPRRTSIPEELANTVTHGVGLVLSLVALPGLVITAARHGNVAHVVTCSVYAATVFFLYGASTLYHGVREPRWKETLRRVDHVCIYLLIAGTYTPFTLVTLGNEWGWILFGLVWGCALIGVFFKIFWTGRFEVISTVTYVLMGWLALIAIQPIVEQFPTGCLLWLLAGGSAYTVGVIFYAIDDRKPYMHATWHLFVLGGSACHYVAVMYYVVPEAPWT